MDLKKHIKNVEHFPKKGINFKDITTLIKDPEAFQFATDELENRLDGIDFDYIVGLDARGFIFGTPLALQMKKGFIPVRKFGKLPRETISKVIETEYSIDKISIHKDDLKKGDKVVIIDDLLATGGSVKATIEILKEMEVEIVKILFIIELTDLNGKDKLYSIPYESLVKYDI